MRKIVPQSGVETVHESTVKPKYSFPLKAVSVYLLVCGVAFGVFYLWTGGLSDDPSLILLPIMLIGLPIALGFFTIKSIEFDDNLMRVRPNLGREICVYYCDIKYIGIAYLLYGNKKLRFGNVKNNGQLREILEGKVKQGLILLDGEAQSAKRNGELRTREATIFALKLSSPLLVVSFFLENAHPIYNIYVVSSFLSWALLFELLYLARTKRNKHKTYLKD